MSAFTLVVCSTCAAEGDAVVLDDLRATVRRCDHGMLVTTGCLLGAEICSAACGHGVTAVLQPCAFDRRPQGVAQWLGPMGDARAVRAVCRWLERGDWVAGGQV